MSTQQLPVDTTAEDQVLAFMLDADNPVAVDELAAKLTAQHFNSSNRSAIFGAIADMRNQNVSVTPASAADYLHERGVAQSHNDLVKFVETTFATETTARAAAERLEKLRAWKAVLSISDQLKRAWTQGGENLDRVISRATTELEELGAKRSTTVKPMSDVMRDRVAELRRAEGRPARRVLTGFGPVDRLVGGFSESGLAILAAGTGGGKTSLASHIAEGVARSGRTVLVASAEMAGWELSDRILARTTQLRAAWIRDNKLEPQQLAQLEEAAKDDAWKRMLVLERDGALTVQQVQRSARQARRNSNLGLIVVDYLQLLTAAGARDPVQEIAAVARGLKNLAMDLGVPVLALSQFNRGADTSTQEPELQHLKGSGEIEQAADTVLFLWRCEKDADNQIRLLCKKNRAGAANRATKLFWNPGLVAFDGEVV